MPTPSPAIPTFTDGLVVHQADLNALGANIANLYDYTQGGFRTDRPMAAVNITSNKTVNAGTTLTVPYDAASLNTDNMWTVTVPTQLTVQTAGTYAIDLVIQTTGNSGSTFVPAACMAPFILINGTAAANQVSGSLGYMPGNSVGPPAACSVIAKLAVGGTIFSQCQNIWSSNIQILSAGIGARLSAIWISP